jgi:hypothetical protein
MPTRAEIEAAAVVIERAPRDQIAILTAHAALEAAERVRGERPGNTHGPRWAAPVMKSTT